MRHVLSIITLVFLLLSIKANAQNREFVLIKVSNCTDSSTVIHPFSNPFAHFFQLNDKSDFSIDFWELNKNTNKSLKNITNYTFNELNKGKYLFLWYGIDSNNEKHYGEIIFRTYIDSIAAKKGRLTIFKPKY